MSEYEYLEQARRDADRARRNDLIKELKSEIERLRAGIKIQGAEINRLCNEIERLRAFNKQLTEAAQELITWWDKQGAWIQSEVHLAERIRVIQDALAAEDKP